jgi:hypothetical protein
MDRHSPPSRFDYERDDDLDDDLSRSPVNPPEASLA